jgi:hypothetical protein
MTSALLTQYRAFHRTVVAQLPPQEFAVRLATKRPIGIAFVADLHLGGEGVDVERIIRDFDLIARTPGLFLSLGGDACDNYIQQKKATAQQESDLQVKWQWKIFGELVEIVKDKLVITGSGNHDAWSMEQAQTDRLEAIYARWQTVYTGEGGLITLTVGQQPYRIFRKHSPVRAKNRTHPTNTIIEELHRGQYDFDLGVMEHEHQPEIRHFVFRERDRIAIRCGTYKTRDRYAEHKGYHPTYGVPVVLFSPTQRQMTALWSLHEAQRML